MNSNSGSEDKYAKAISERQKHVDEILNSPSKKKIVVAGPGTGKTYLFKRILDGKKKTLTLTFVTSLVEDLSLELCGLSDVRTLHAFARSALGKDVKVFPKLSGVIREDAKLLLNEEIDFDSLFHNRDDENQHIEFYKKRKNYYKHYGFADIVFAIVKFFEEKKDRIPTYEQVVVDEFQDFNKLEVSLIDLLAERSPVLLVGDDDQALYDFKSASTEHIRHRHGDENSGYTPFNLPYCSRCTRVIVETANDIINNAKKNGYLKGRIKKPYKYFEDRKKDKESAHNPKVIYARLFAKQIPWFIENQIGKIAKEVKGTFSVLIISPTKNQSRMIVDGLKNKGLENIDFVEKQDQMESTLLDGLKILLEDKKSNLGWRIVSRFLLKETDFESLIRKTWPDGAKDISDVVDAVIRQEVAEMLKVLRAIKGDEEIDEEQLGKVLIKVGFDPHETTKNLLKNEIVSSSRRFGNPSIRKIPIKATTIQSSKGLAAEYVFITHFDDLYFIKDKDKTKISDRDICNFLVALTRAEKRVFLISSDTKKMPTFLKWIDEDRIENVEGSIPEQ